VICVGALNNDAATAQSYSNFGRNVAIFAPTNIPVMLRPTTSDPAGPVALSTFGGTSASAPFVAGVAAMMKAINPDLNSDDVYRILRETAHRGTAPVDYYIDAFAAVHRAAEGIAIVPDRFEPNNGPGAPATLGGFAPYSAPDLNLSAADQDWFKFESPGASQMTINLQSPSGLGHISVISLLSLGETCGSPELISDSPGTNTRVLTYNVPGGPLQLGLRADDVNAYNLTISFTAAAVAPDIYEVNDDVAAAKYIHGFAPGTGTFGAEFVIHPSVTIEATLHNSAAPADTDYYIVRGASLSNAETALLSGGPFLSVYANTASIAMQVFLLNADGTQGAGVFEGSALSCAQGLAATLQSDVYYLVRVAGFPGQYTLFNGAIADPALLPPILVGGFPGEIIQPGPVEIERNLAFPELFLFLADPAFDTVVSDNPAVHLSLFALGGELLAEGAASGAGERLSIANLQATQGYALKAEPTDLSAGPLRLRLEWESAAPLRASENLIANPGAEIAVGPDPDQFIPYWDIESSATTLVYGDQPGDPSLSDPGPADRGLTFFAGGTDNSSSAILQVIEVDPAWQEAINAGRVRFRFAAFLGGNLQQADSASGRLIFRRSSSDEGVISEVSLPAVTPLDRAGQTSLFPVEVHDHVPADTTIMIVEVRFTGGQGNFNDGYADNLELVLSEYPQ
jgi:subtilisin family serine protease